MASKLYFGSGSATPSIVVEKIVPGPTPSSGNSIVYNNVNGKLTAPTTFIDLDNITDIGDDILVGTYKGNESISGPIDLSSLTTVSGNNACKELFNSKYYDEETWEEVTTDSNITSVDLSNVATISGSNAFQQAFQGCGKLTSADLSSLATVSGNNACNCMFQDCESLASVDLSNLTTISGEYSFGEVFKNCTDLESIDLSNLTTISGNGSFSGVFYGCTKLKELDLHSLTTVADWACSSIAQSSSIEKIDLSGLTSLKGGQFGYMASDTDNLVEIDLRNVVSISSTSGGSIGIASQCRGLKLLRLDNLETISGNRICENGFSYSGLESITFPKLTTINGNQAMIIAFQDCHSLKHIYFPALQTISYQNTFYHMLSWDSGVTVHFPASLQSVIGSWSDIANGMNGTNTTILFDL